MDVQKNGPICANQLVSSSIYSA